MATGPTCDCDGCQEFRAIHARFSAELSREVREAKRERDRAAQRRYENTLAEHTPTLPWAV